MHVGDIFAWKALPYVDAGNGGSVMQQGKSLSKAVATVKNVDTIINGHIPVSTWNDLKEYAQFTSEFAASREKEMKAGKTAAQAADEYKLDPEVQGLRRQRESAVRRRESQHRHRVQRDEEVARLSTFHGSDCV